MIAPILPSKNTLDLCMLTETRHDRKLISGLIRSSSLSCIRTPNTKFTAWLKHRCACSLLGAVAQIWTRRLQPPGAWISSGHHVKEMY